MYRALHFFRDLTDDRHEYREGDTFPREGLEVPAERIAQLLSSENNQRRPVIEAVMEDDKPRRGRKRKADDD